MHKFLPVTAAVAMILPVMALAENDQFHPEQNTSVLGGSIRPLLSSQKGRRTNRRNPQRGNRLHPPRMWP